jgi:DNA mismatch repair ATPase MutS
MYTCMVGRDKIFDYLLHKLRARIAMDLKKQEDMIQLIGAVEQIFSMATVAPSLDEVQSEDTSWKDIPADNIQNIETLDTCKNTLNLPNGHEVSSNEHERGRIENEVDFVVSSSEID